MGYGNKDNDHHHLHFKKKEQENKPDINNNNKHVAPANEQEESPLMPKYQYHRAVNHEAADEYVEEDYWSEPVGQTKRKD